MKCPACFNSLTEVQIGAVAVDICRGGCGGIWFDPFELQRVDEQHEAAGEGMLEIERDPSVVADFTRKRECPRCADVKLNRHFFSPKRKVQVDECPNCGGYWLDAGELAAIRAEKASNINAAGSPRPGISSDVIRYLYRMRNEDPGS
jgi:Zn-finger nucleic acid-binding protein